jgi:glycosyltransferase involved in cell wall biosynthesis
MGLARPPRVLRHLAYFAQAVVLWHRCERDGISHVHAHFANVASDLALLASSLGGAGFSWSFTMHGPTEFFDVHQYRLREKTIDAAFVVCISDFARSQLMSLSPPSAWDSLYVVPCGVDVTHFVGQRPEHGESAAPPPAQPTDAVDILCVGRLVPEKGHTVLIRTVAALRSHGLEARLTLVGDGPERATLESLVEKLGQTSYVSFRGSISHAEIKRMLSECDIFCLPSFAEGVPIVLMEAMAMGLPVVACRVMGIPELIEDRVSGRLVRPGSADELASVLSELIASPVLRSSLGQAACEQVTARFNLGVNVARLHALYREQLA